MQYDACAPRPTRPRSWCSCDRPNRSACSTTITVAFGTSTPTSTTVVETSTSNSPRANARHHAFLLVRLHPAVQQRDAVGREDVLREVVGHLGRRLEVDLLRLLDQRVDDVGLPARVDLLADEVVDLVAARFRLGDRLDRLPARRHLAHHRDVEVAVGRQRQRARNRRRGHHQHVGVQPLGAQRRPLHHAEAVLLVDDHQPQLAERDRILHQRVRADDQVERAGGQLRLRLAPLPRRRRCRSAAPSGSATTRAACGS